MGMVMDMVADMGMVDLHMAMVIRLMAASGKSKTRTFSPPIDALTALFPIHNIEIAQCSV
ncbi:hypothetical protein D3C75_1062390 [compost metagenome]